MTSGGGAVLDGFGGDGPHKTAAAVTEVEQDTAPAGFPRYRTDVSAEAADQMHLLVVVHVRVQVTGAHDVEKFVLHVAVLVGVDVVVDEDRDVGELACLDGSLENEEAGRAGVVFLDSDDEGGVFVDLGCRSLCVHVVGVAFGGGTHHAGADDVQIGEDTRLDAVDDLGLEAVEGAPPGSTAIDDGGRACDERRVVGKQAARKAEDVRMDVDQARCDIEAADVDDLLGFGWRDVVGDHGDLVTRDGEVRDPVDFVGRINDMSALKEEVVDGLRG